MKLLQEFGMKWLITHFTSVSRRWMLVKRWNGRIRNAGDQYLFFSPRSKSDRFEQAVFPICPSDKLILKAVSEHSHIWFSLKVVK